LEKQLIFIPKKIQEKNPRNHENIGATIKFIKNINNFVFFLFIMALMVGKKNKYKRGIDIKIKVNMIENCEAAVCIPILDNHTVKLWR
jgi:hypothetical protein